MGVSLASLLRDLQLAFPDRPVPPDTLRLYARELQDVSVAILEPAVSELIRTETRFPRLATIRTLAAERSLGLPSDAEALGQVEARIAWGQHRDDGHAAVGPPPLINPVVRDALAVVGGFASYRLTDQPSIVRAQFLNAYRDLRARAVRDLVVAGFRKEIEPG